MENTEVWKPVVGYEGYYEVSSIGRVKRVKAGQGTRAGYVLKPVHLKHGGYLAAGLRRPGHTRKLARIHRLVAEAFLGVSDLPLVRHLDGDPTNNRVENLAHGTSQENAFDRVRHGRASDVNGNSKKTSCKWGHPFTAENTKLRLNHQTKRMSRQCRQCERLRRQRKYWKKKAEAGL